MLVTSSLILGLSSCAFALNARSDGYGYGYGYRVDKNDATSTPCEGATSAYAAPAYPAKTPSASPGYGPSSGYAQASGYAYSSGYGTSILKPSGYNQTSSGYPRPSSSVRPGGYNQSSSSAPYPTSRANSTSSIKPGPTASSSCTPYWLENIGHQGIAAFNVNPGSYKVFRNVKDYGAKGNGVDDDTAAIQRAITEGNRCAPGFCESTTTTPAVVYFPSGTYVISSSIIDYYYTQIIGNPNCLPIIQASANFSSTGGLGLIDGSPYLGVGNRVGKTGYGPTNTFFRQIRNIILDMTKIPANVAATGIHWPTAQTTSLQNVVFNMNAANGTQHQGLFIEEGSGGFMTDLVFNGGKNGFNVGNQQFTTRNLTFNNIDTAVNQLWDWGWTYSGVKINNCRVGFNFSAGGTAAVNVGSVTLLDSEISNTQIGITTTRTDTSEPDSAGSLYLENVKLNNVGVAVLGPSGTYLAGSPGSASVIAAWADGHRYTPNGPNELRGAITPSKRPASLLDAQGNYYTRSKPQYGYLPLNQFLSARSLGVTGDGKTDDTAKLNAAILKAQQEGKVLFIDAGYYKVAGTIYVPPGSKIVGEALATVILSAGSFFNDINAPQPVVQVARPGEQGQVEISDLFVSSQGQQKGAIFIEYNLASIGEPAGLWDVHTRVGGFAGSNLQTEQCEKTPSVKVTEANLVQECIAAYMSVHVTKFATGLYLENNWLWVADHDLDDARNNNTQITIYAGRGLHIESQLGRLWLYGTAVEHHVKYEYQFVDTREVFMGQIQTETAYYQPNPDALIPFPENKALSDPVFTPSSGVNSASGWGLRIVRSNNILGYGVGLYSFFDNYSTDCSQVGAGARCQTRILSIEGDRNSYDINLYNLNTVGTTQMITRDGIDLASNVDNNSTFVDTINLFRIDSFGQ